MIEVEIIKREREYTCNACITGVAVMRISMGDPKARISYSLCADCQLELGRQLLN